MGVDVEQVMENSGNYKPYLSGSARPQFDSQCSQMGSRRQTEPYLLLIIIQRPIPQAGSGNDDISVSFTVNTFRSVNTPTAYPTLDKSQEALTTMVTRSSSFLVLFLAGGKVV